MNEILWMTTRQIDEGQTPHFFFEEEGARNARRIWMLVVALW